MVELISIHIGKTAGMSFRQVLTDVYRDENILWDYAPYAYKKPDKLPQAVKAVHGHVSIQKYQGYFEDAKRITWLRHPVFRLFSEYHFAKKYKDPYNALAVKLVKEKLSFEAYIEQENARNIMSKQIEGLELEDFFFVGIQEFYQEDLAYLEKLMDWGMHSIARENVNMDKRYRQALLKLYANEGLLSKIAELNTEDFELYERSLHMRARRTGKSALSLQTISMCKRALDLVK